MVLRQPIPDKTKRIGVPRQIDAVAQRRGGTGSRGDDGKVENGERNHGPKLVRVGEPTKGPVAQIRRAPDRFGLACRDALGRKIGIITSSRSAHIYTVSKLDVSRTLLSDFRRICPIQEPPILPTYWKSYDDFPSVSHASGQFPIYDGLSEPVCIGLFLALRSEVEFVVP